jgi:undecaprenyl-diphosphatase
MIDHVSAARPIRQDRLRHAARASAALLAVWAIATGVLVAVGQSIVQSTAITSWDARVTRYVVAHRTVGLNSLMKALTWAGSWVAAFALVVLVAVLAWRHRMAPVTVLVVAALWLGELAAVTLTKSVVHRPRPPEQVRLVQAHGWSFPSGHTANAVVVFVTLALIVAALVGRLWVRTLVWVLALLALGLVGFSRVELGVHWASDVIASWIWCPCWMLLAALTLGVPVLHRVPFDRMAPQT